MAKVKEIQVCGSDLFTDLYCACENYIQVVNDGVDREKLNFSIELKDGQVKHITIRQTEDGIVAYGDFEGLPNALEWSQGKE